MSSGVTKLRLTLTMTLSLSHVYSLSRPVEIKAGSQVKGTTRQIRKNDKSKKDNVNDAHENTNVDDAHTSSGLRYDI
jgi:hypothetical protein